MIRATKGRNWERVRYGDEADDYGADYRSCRDCGAVKGQLHRMHCCIERCGRCGAQALTCRCRIPSELRDVH